MRNWTADDLDTIGATAEVDVAPLRPDGSLRPSTPIWIVRVGDDLYVRSYRGRRGSWFNHALQRHEGRIRIGALQRDVIFEEPATPMIEPSTRPTGPSTAGPGAGMSTRW